LVLIYPGMHHEGMIGLLFIVFVLLVAVLAPFVGADSRLDEVTRRRRLGHS
jgi:hypothetical protein